MKQLFATLIITAIALASFAQVNYKTIKTHTEAGSTLTRICIDEPLIPNSDGAYGFRMKAPIPFTSFAIGFDATDRNAPEGHFIVYYRTSQGEKWTNWKDDHGYFRPEYIEPNIFYTDLLFGFNLNMHDSIEYLIFPPVNVQLTKIELVFQDITSENEKAANQTTHINATRDGNCLEFPEYVPRSSWCGNYDECLNPTYSPAYITCTHTIIHHGASPDEYTDGAAVVRSYWNYHVNTQGWSDIGYNYLFDKNGNMYQGRYNPNLPTSDVKGAHAGNCNNKSIGLNFIGNSDSPATAPTNTQLEKCWDMLAWWYDNKQLDPTSSADITNQAGQFTFSRYRISGHRDVNQTASGQLGTTCPGETLYAMLPNFRVQVARKMNDCGWNIVLPEEDTVPPTTEITADEWNNGDFKVSFNDRTNTSKAFYQILDKEDGKWTTNASRGTLYEKFDEQAIPDGWTAANGTWEMNSGSIMQTDEELTSTNLHYALHQERGYTYLYHAKMKITGEGSNRRAGFYFFTDNAERQNGYMMFIRPDHNTAQLYKYVDGSFSDNGGTYTSLSYTINADQWYDIKIIFDTNTGKITCYVDDIIAVTLNDSNPFTSGECFSLRTAGCNTEYKDIYVTRSRNVSSEITATTGEDGDIRTESTEGSMAGKIRTILLGNNGMWSDYFEQDVKVDWTAPETEISTDSEWNGNDFTATFDDSDNNFVSKRFYNVISFNGEEWVATNANGFAHNDFDRVIGNEWTSVAGSWSIVNGHLTQTETGTSNLYATVNQTLADKYLYEFNFRMSDGSNNQRIGLHYMSTDGQTENHGNGYFIYFRLSTSSSRVEFYRVENDTYSQDKCIDLPLNTNCWHNVKLIYDRTNGKSSIYYDDKYYGSYTAANFFTEGNIVALRNGGATADFDDFRIYRSRGTSATITVGENGDIAYTTPDENNEFATISSVTIDSAQNIATYHYSVANDSTTVSIDIENASTIAIYPTPNNGNFSLRIDSNHIGQQLTITDISGKIVYARKIEDENSEIRLGKISAGIYIAQIGENKLKFIVE